MKIDTPARRANSLCICPSVGPGKTSSVAPWHDYEQFHSQPDGTAGVNADGDLTHSPDYPTASQTCARLVPERLLLHATLTISPAMATAGRHHRSCMATSPRPHTHLLDQARPVRLPLPIIPGVNATAHRFGGFGLSITVASKPGVSEGVSCNGIAGLWPDACVSTMTTIGPAQRSPGVAGVTDTKAV